MDLNKLNNYNDMCRIININNSAIGKSKGAYFDKVKKLMDDRISKHNDPFKVDSFCQAVLSLLRLQKSFKNENELAGFLLWTCRQFNSYQVETTYKKLDINKALKIVNKNFLKLEKEICRYNRSLGGSMKLSLNGWILQEIQLYERYFRLKRNRVMAEDIIERIKIHSTGILIRETKKRFEDLGSRPKLKELKANTFGAYTKKVEIFHFDIYRFLSNLSFLFLQQGCYSVASLKRIEKKFNEYYDENGMQKVIRKPGKVLVKIEPEEIN